MKAILKNKKWYIPQISEAICKESAIWINAQDADLSPQELWDICPQGDWMLWALRKTDKVPDTTYREMAYSFAASALPYAGENIEVYCDTLDVVSRYIDGEATLKDLSDAASAADASAAAAYAASDADSLAASSATHTAYAAAHAAHAAYAASSDDAGAHVVYAAHASASGAHAAHAAYAAYAASSDDAAHAASSDDAAHAAYARGIHADIIRHFIPKIEVK